MDKTKQYRKAVKKVLENYDKKWALANGLENRLVFDLKRNFFVFLTFGWQNSETYTHLLCFHIEIIAEKVWIHENNTDAMIAVDLIEQGVLPEDIVLGFSTPAKPAALKTVLLIN